MRVSIVATSLDGQQPEPKSVINMVHRIQNRNPGYSDFSNSVSSQSFSFSNQNNTIMTNGANALKIEEETKTETEEASSISNSEEITSSLNTEEETSPVKQEFATDSAAPTEKHENSEINSSPSNGLENFDFDEETPELFNSDGSIEDAGNEENPSTTDTESTEEDELEIPAFLRRQKN